MKRALLVALAVLLAAIVGLVVALFPIFPPVSATRGELIEGQLVVDGIDRRFEAYLPPELPAGAPLVFVIHGSGMDAASMRDVTGSRFAWLADRDGFAVAYPEGFEREWNGCRAPGVTQADLLDLDDVGFVTAIADYFVREHGSDPARVYAAGFSNGGQLAYRLASDRPQRFAAIAAVVAQVPEPENSKCQEPRGPIPVLIMNGTADPVVPWRGGVASLFGWSSRGRVRSSQASAAHWVAVNGAGVESTSTSLPDLDSADGSTLERITWAGGTDREVVLYAVHGGAHSIPGGVELGSPSLTRRWVGATNRDAQGADLIWEFLRRHQRGMATP